MHGGGGLFLACGLRFGRFRMKKKVSLFSSQPGSLLHLSLVREAANFKLRYGRKKECISDLEQLWKQNPKDVHTLAQLISAYSLVNQDKAKAYPYHVPFQYLCHEYWWGGEQIMLYIKDIVFSGREREIIVLAWWQIASPLRQTVTLHINMSLSSIRQTF